MKERIYVDGKVAGTIENEVFVRKVKKNEYFRTLCGYSLALSTIEQLKEKNINQIRIIEKWRENRILNTTLDNWLTKGKEIDFGEKQICLPVNNFGGQK